MASNEREQKKSKRGWDTSLKYKDLKRVLKRTEKEKCWKKLTEELENNISGNAYKIAMKRFEKCLPVALTENKRSQVIKSLVSIPEAIEGIPECVLEIMDGCMEEGNFPELWNTARVVRAIT